MVKAIVLVACLALAPTLVLAGVPDTFEPPRAEVLQGPYEPLSLFCTPSGGGDAFSEAKASGGSLQDATLVIQFRDYFTDEPLAGIPAQDIWIATAGSALAPCGGAVIPDAQTDAEGRTTWAAPLHVGGQFISDARDHLGIVVNGEWTIISRTMDMRFNSADIDGDGVVNLSDAGAFTMDLYGPYAYRSDFNWDGTINVSDAGEMSKAMGDRCP